MVLNCSRADFDVFYVLALNSEVDLLGHISECQRVIYPVDAAVDIHMSPAGSACHRAS